MLLSCANARPDLSLGYRYNQGHNSGGGSFLTAPGSISSSYSPVASGNSYYNNQPSIGQVGTTQIDYGTPSTQIKYGFNQGSIGGFNTAPTFGVQQQGFQAPIVTKHFYLHTAPADNDQQAQVRHIQIGQPQKNYRVVFIDTPSSNSAKAKIIADVAPTEEKTAIYVLSKKQNELDIETEVNTPAPVNNKPEVFFIKYKTPEEAVHAQHTIQAQYDNLGGSSDVSNEGQIPVSSVIGSLDGSNGGPHGGSSVGPSGLIGGGSVGPSGQIGVVGIGPSGPNGGLVHIEHTGINTQKTYLPANLRYRIKK